MLARFSVSTFSIPAQAVYSQPSDSTASFTGMVNSWSHSSGRVVGNPYLTGLWKDCPSSDRNGNGAR
jgi:hypothetical protein